mgnify:CR=1 FL=1
MTFWRCKWTRRPHGCTTSPRNGPASWCRTFIFHLLRRDNQLPVACAMWQARSSGKPSACPYAARSTHISHTHLAHTSRFELGSPRVSPGGCPPRPATGTVTAGLLLRLADPPAAVREEVRGLRGELANLLAGVDKLPASVLDDGVFAQHGGRLLAQRAKVVRDGLEHGGELLEEPRRRRAARA